MPYKKMPENPILPEKPTSLQYTGYSDFMSHYQKELESIKQERDLLQENILNDCKKAVEIVNDIKWAPLINAKEIAAGYWTDDDTFNSFIEYENWVELVEYKCYEG